MKAKKVVVIGAGLGGLSAAISLASQGFEVQILEKNAQCGGKLNVIQKQGFSFDLGPSILTMPHIFERLFERAGKRMADYLTITAVEPHWRNFFEDGLQVDLSGDPQRLQQELAKLGPGVYADFERFLVYAKKIVASVEEGYFQHGLDNLGQVLKHYGLRRSILDFDIFRSMDSGIKRYIKDPKLIDILNYFIKYVGSSPYDAPALMNLLPAIQFMYGLWYVKGGMYALAQALEKLALELGVAIHLNTEVHEIEHTAGRVTCVRAQGLGLLNADLIVSNMEVLPLYRKLMKDQQEESRRLRRFEASCSGLVVHLGVDRFYPQLAHHNFFYSEDPRQHFNSIFKSAELSDDPTLYVVAPVHSDPGQAPAGCEVIKILPHIPHLRDDRPFTEQDYAALRERVLIKLERMGLTDLRRHIVCEETWTPEDIERQYYSNKGSIYGVLTDRFKNQGFKIAQRSRVFSNLYFVGGSVNPGGGMPMVTLSGQLVCDKILSDLKSS